MANRKTAKKKHLKELKQINNNINITSKLDIKYNIKEQKEDK